MPNGPGVFLIDYWKINQLPITLYTTREVKSPMDQIYKIAIYVINYVY